MAAIDGLIDVADRAAQAQDVARAITWLDQNAVEAAAERVSEALNRDRDALGRPRLSAVPPSAVWQRRVAEVVASDRR